MKKTTLVLVNSKCHPNNDLLLLHFLNDFSLHCIVGDLEYSSY